MHVHLHDRPFSHPLLSLEFDPDMPYDFSLADLHPEEHIIHSRLSHFSDVPPEPQPDPQPINLSSLDP
ncbi:uncharacterized protein DS421_11g330850 [Arachis hypogaea]|nr:uncharacterized protein DS421_11g330850 [Arachis hypogaea]